MREAPRLPLADLLERVRAECRDMPGLQLTPSRAIRLFDVEPSVCASMLEVLVKECFLFRTRDGMFMQSSAQE